MRKQIKSFSLSPNAIESLKIEAKKQDRSESKIVDMALSKLFGGNLQETVGDSRNQLDLLEK